MSTLSKHIEYLENSIEYYEAKMREFTVLMNKFDAMDGPTKTYLLLRTPIDVNKLKLDNIDDREQRDACLEKLCELLKIQELENGTS